MADISDLEASVEHDDRVLQALAIKVSDILKQEILRSKLVCSFFEARVYNIKTVGVQGDGRAYGHPAEITLQAPKHPNGKPYSDQDRSDFLAGLSTRVTNEVRGIVRVVYAIAENDDGSKLLI